MNASKGVNMNNRDHSLVACVGVLIAYVCLAISAGTVCFAADLDNDTLNALMHKKEGRKQVFNALKEVFDKQGKQQCGEYVNNNTLINGKERIKSQRVGSYYETDKDGPAKKGLIEWTGSVVHPRPGDTLITQNAKDSNLEFDPENIGYFNGHVSVVIAYDEKNNAVWVAEANRAGDEEFGIRYRPLPVISCDIRNEEKDPHKRYELDSDVTIGALDDEKIFDYGFQRSEFTSENKNALLALFPVSLEIPDNSVVKPMPVSTPQLGNGLQGVNVVGVGDDEQTLTETPAGSSQSAEPVKTESYKWPEPIKW